MCSSVYVRMSLEARGVRSLWSWSYRHCEAIEMGAGAQLRTSAAVVCTPNLHEQCLLTAEPSLQLPTSFSVITFFCIY